MQCQYVVLSIDRVKDFKFDFRKIFVVFCPSIGLRMTQRISQLLALDKIFGIFYTLLTVDSSFFQSKYTSASPSVRSPCSILLAFIILCFSAAICRHSYARASNANQNYVPKFYYLFNRSFLYIITAAFAKL